MPATQRPGRLEEAVALQRGADDGELVLVGLDERQAQARRRQ